MLPSSAFFKLFPPPSFLLMPHAGLDVSDDSIRALSYTGFDRHRSLGIYGHQDLPEGLIDGGDVKDEKELIARLKDFSEKYKLRYVKVSIPEEKAYLFQTEVPLAEFSEIVQNIEFKLEENVPLSAPDALFYFDLIPGSVQGGELRASVSVVPRTYVERYADLLRQAGLTPVAFEVIPKSIARAVVPRGDEATRLILHVMNKKTGMYIISGGVVNFASTVAWGSGGSEAELREAAVGMSKEIARVHSYWGSHGTGKPISEVIIVGRNAQAFEPLLEQAANELAHMAHVADVWRNAFEIGRVIPPISKADSFEYAVAIGLAFELSQPL